MVNGTIEDETCSAFSRLDDPGEPQLIRFVVGEDASPRRLNSAETSQELGDPFARLLLAQGMFPATSDELLDAIDAAVGSDDSLGVSSQKSFILGEGSQLPIGPGDTGSTNLGMRFLVTRGAANHGPEIVISASHPGEGLIELMAWDVGRGGFNYYRTIGDSGAWAFAGNSRHSLSEPTKGKGPFESHPSGHLIMKELKFPWVHWHSFKVNVFDGVFPEGDERRTHPWFTEKSGADVCETAVVMPSVRRWTTARFDQAVQPDGTFLDPPRVIEQVITSPTVNLASSSRESAAAVAGATVDLPPGFFVDVEALAELGLPGPPSFAVPGAIYSASLQRFGFVLRDHEGFEQRGDTHFAFVVPERSFEDNETLRHAIARGLVTKRLAAALVMVDFPNPVFSKRRAALLQHAPPTATIAGGESTFSEEMAARILDTAEATAEGSAEKEFVGLWAAGEDWPAVFGARLQSYYDAVLKRVGTQEGFDDYTMLAEARRNRVRRMPIFESPLLFPETNIPRATGSMNADGTVTEGPEEDQN